MASNIDPSHPAEGYAYTANVRANFQAAWQEITDLQSQVASLQTLMSQVQQNISVLQARQMAAGSTTSNAPPGTQSPSFVTAGLGVVYTSTSSTRGLFTAEGSLGNDTNNQASDAQLVWGNGAPPANGVLVTDANGTLVGAPINILTSKPGEMRPFSVTAIITGLVPSEPYWVDIAYMAEGGTAELSEITITAFELLDPVSSTP